MTPHAVAIPPRATETGHDPDGPVRVLYSFPHRLGVGRICDTAFYQVQEAARAGARVTAVVGSLERPFDVDVPTVATLALGRARVPYRVLGQLRALRLHDHLVARRLERAPDRFDVVHAWPLGALETLETAERLGIPTVLERPNAHTRFAFETVRSECERLGVELPPGQEHAYDDAVLLIEEAEYALATRLLCPSDFVARTFEQRGFAPSRLVRHFYGYDPAVFAPAPRSRPELPLRMLYVGVAAVRKGLHFALEAWLCSPASETGTFLVAGEILPAYGEVLAEQLAHPSVEVLGHRSDVADLMRNSDVLVLPSLEEGSALVCNEAIASGCVPLVSDAASGVCRHGVNALVHAAADVGALTEHITAVDRDRNLLTGLREGALASAPDITWEAAGRRLAGIYEAVREGARA
jgi:glycosyltransferase involved in cell wall biosynthesis